VFSLAGVIYLGVTLLATVGLALVGRLLLRVPMRIA
jgi:hypothetical protein